MRQIYSLQVECDFSTTPPTNILHHNLEARIKAKSGSKQYEAAGGYSVSVTYTDVDLDSVKAFVAQADSCTQHVKYDCKGSILFNYGWFRDGNGKHVKSYFPGGNETIGGCACYVTRSCATTSREYKCL